MYETILFLDFDGTITSEETLEGSMRLCIDPLLYKEKEQEMLEGKRTLADTLHLAFSMITCDCMEEIKAYVRGVPLRPGFGELLDLAKEKEVVVGVYRLTMKVLCVDGRISLESPHEAGGDLMEKTRIMAQYDFKEAICVGDGHTDVRMALASDLVFARDTLAAILKKRGVSYKPWDDFHDIARWISSSR